MLSSTSAHENRGAHGTVRAMRVPAQGGARERHQATPGAWRERQCVGSVITREATETN